MSTYTIRAYQKSNAKYVALLSKELGYPATSSEIEGRFVTLSKHMAFHGIFVAQLSTEENIVGWIHVY